VGAYFLKLGYKTASQQIDGAGQWELLLEY
jgi:hypothetical protein